MYRLHSSAFLRALASKVVPSSTTGGREEKSGMPAISTPCCRAMPAKSRSLPALEVAIKILRISDFVWQRTFQFNRDLTFLKPSRNKHELPYSHWGGTTHGELGNPCQRRSTVLH